MELSRSVHSSSSHSSRARLRQLVGQVVPGTSAELAILQSSRCLGLPPLTVTVIAAGNAGHVCAALFEQNTKGRVRTQLLTSKPQLWKSDVQPRVQFPSGDWQVGRIHKVSNNPAELIPQSDIVLWTGPVAPAKEIFEQIRPYLDTQRTTLGMIFAHGLVHVMAEQVFGPDLRFFALTDIPWQCKVMKPGEESAIVGCKSLVEVSTMNIERAEEWVKSNLEPLFVLQKSGSEEPVLGVLPDFCPVVFNTTKQIITPPRYWSLFRSWRKKPMTGKEEPSEWLYRGMDKVSGDLMLVLDEELQSLKQAVFEVTEAKGCKSVLPLRERLLRQYGAQIKDASTLAKAVGSNRAFAAAKTPTIRTMLGVMPDPNCQALSDDIGWGLCTLVSVADRLADEGVQTPTTMMRMLIEWHQKLLGKEYLIDGKLRGRDCADLVLLRPSDPLDLVAKSLRESKSEWLPTADHQTDEDRIGNP